MTKPYSSTDRRQGERRGVGEAPTNPDRLLPVTTDSPKTEDVDARPRRSAFGAFAAQMLGQGGQKRGLRGGPETLEQARSTYLETEWSGPADRRPRPGRITKTEI